MIGFAIGFAFGCIATFSCLLWLALKLKAGREAEERRLQETLKKAERRFSEQAAEREMGGVGSPERVN